ncbi:MAG: hypothetical protein GXP24_05270, partial [Planctomycetes bacterium]|nr:hypothetical protein [Planctomycetota bacterium]
MRNSFSLYGLACTITLVAFGSVYNRASATLVGTDDASQAVYDDSWGSGDDGSATGDAFGVWTLNTTGGTSGQFIGDSKNLSGGSGADINVSGESFGLFGGSGSSATATRSLNGTLEVGQTFSLDLAVNFRNGAKGFNLFDASSTQLFNFNVGGDDYVVNSATTGTGSIGNAYSPDTSFNLSFLQTSATGGDWTITRTGGVTDLDTGTYTGIAASFEFYVNGTDGGSPNDLFVNNLSAVPEPSAFLFGGLICGVLGVNFAR